MTDVMNSAILIARKDTVKCYCYQEEADFSLDLHLRRQCSFGYPFQRLPKFADFFVKPL